MPGFVLSQAESMSLKYSYDAKELRSNFPNLDVNRPNTPPGSDVVLDRSNLGAGKMLDASLAISGQGTGDLYVVLMMPNGQYLSLGETRLASAIGEVIPFREAINLSAVKTLPLVNLPLPSGLVEGTYTFYAIFVAEKANVYDESNWVSLASSEWSYD